MQRNTRYTPGDAMGRDGSGLVADWDWAHVKTLILYLFDRAPLRAIVVRPSDSLSISWILPIHLNGRAIYTCIGNWLTDHLQMLYALSRSETADLPHYACASKPTIWFSYPNFDAATFEFGALGSLSKESPNGNGYSFVIKKPPKSLFLTFI